MIDTALQQAIAANVSAALAEDIGSGDLTAALLPPDAVAGAKIVAREDAVVAGGPWVDETYRRLDPSIVVDWYVCDGQRAETGDVICKLVGPTGAILSGERTALNFLQTLSATATATSRYVAAVAGTGAVILDTRKTLPGLRYAQKYAVRQGGGANHRIGLFDAILIKENHIAAAGGIGDALSAGGNIDPDIPVEVEVESLDELRAALDAGATRILLDNFDLDRLRAAVALNKDFGTHSAELEASGNVTVDTVRKIAETGVDYVSIGDLTKNIRAADLSMLLTIN